MTLWVLGGVAAGLIVGSFLATLVLRWPQGQSVGGRSVCDACGRQLSARELVPFISALASGDRCRTCGGVIDPTHRHFEVACAVVGGLAFAVAPGVGGAAAALAGWLLVALAWLDARHFWLPDRLTGALAVCAIGGALLGVPPAPVDRLIGGTVGYASLTLIAWGYRRWRGRDGLGGGDPKILGAIGLWLGWQALPFVLVGASATGLAGVAVMALLGRRITATTQVPLGSLLAVAAFAVWLILSPSIGLPLAREP